MCRKEQGAHLGMEAGILEIALQAPVGDAFTISCSVDGSMGALPAVLSTVYNGQV